MAGCLWQLEFFHGGQRDRGNSSGYAGSILSWAFEVVVMRLSDIFMSFPSTILILFLVSMFGPSIITVTVVIGVLGWPKFARQIYGSVLSIREKDYIEGAVAIGAKDKLIITRYILPNAVAPIFISITFRIASAIILESSLSFLGMGVQPPAASWGNMLYNAQSITILTSRPWMWVPPGLALVITILSINFIGNGLRDALDPKTAKNNYRRRKENEEDDKNAGNFISGNDSAVRMRRKWYNDHTDRRENGNNCCSGKTGTETAQKGPKDEVVTMAVISSWDTLNIYNTSGNYGNAVADQLFERLVTRTHDGVIEPRLATEWQIADDNKSMTFKLAENALWHDGEKLTANDIVFTCKAMTNPDVDNYYRSAFNVLAGTDDDGIAADTDQLGVEAVDDYTVKFSFKEPKDQDTILNAFLSFLYVLPEHILDTGNYADINTSSFWTSPVGAGPFKYVKDTAGETLEMEAFEDYYQGCPDFKTLVVRVVPAANLTAGLLNGDIDVVGMGSIPLSDWATVKGSDSCGCFCRRLFLSVYVI